MACWRARAAAHLAARREVAGESSRARKQRALRPAPAPRGISRACPRLSRRAWVCSCYGTVVVVLDFDSPLSKLAEPDFYVSARLRRRSDTHTNVRHSL